MENNLSLRDTIKDLNLFRVVTDPKGKAPTSKKPAVVLAAETRAKTNSTTIDDLLTQLRLTRPQFLDIYNKILKTMGLQKNQSSRLSKDLGTRLVSTSALLWNRYSHYKSRDWGLVAIALALETAYLPIYRRKLLTECPGARTIRRILHSHFLALASSRAESSPTSSRMTYVTTWEFTDGYSLAEDGAQPSVHSLEALLTHWRLARNKFDHGEKDPTYDFIRSAEKNKYLQSTTSGCVETSASHHITALAEVCPPSLFFPFFSTFPSDHLQE